jgi:hypothetical protein
MSEGATRMNTHPDSKIAFLMALALGIVVSSHAAGADRNASLRDSKKHQRMAYLDAAPVNYEFCQTGWWQTLRYGHVRPQWRTGCR